MPDRTRKTRPTDPDELAASIVADATDEDAEAPDGLENGSQADEADLTDEELARRAARLLGSLGGRKGGPARAKKLSAERRREIARAAAVARWSKTD